MHVSIPQLINQVAAGNEHSAVITKTGEVYTFGFNGSGQLGHNNNKSITSPKIIESLNGIFAEKVSSANGCEHLSLMTDDGKLYTCGYNNYG